LKRPLVTALTSLGTLVSASLFSVTATTAPAEAADAGGRYESRVIGQMNDERRPRGRVPLSGGACLDGYAERHARRLARQQAFHHQNLRPILDRCNRSRVGENLARLGGTGSPSRVVSLWMNSAGHRANILERRYRTAGVGTARDARGRLYVVAVFGAP
jgi:uncharacterized protein YkwD